MPREGRWAVNVPPVITVLLKLNASPGQERSGCGRSSLMAKMEVVDNNEAGVFMENSTACLSHSHEFRCTEAVSALQIMLRSTYAVHRWLRGILGKVLSVILTEHCKANGSTTKGERAAESCVSTCALEINPKRENKSR